ncbi:hypothetical protein [Alteromonas australica]|uniref:hypothetical protein n=1 Tax=Alteromonas australica TaxID=589873 RepID=UPI0035C82AE2
MKTPHRSITFSSITPFVMAWALSWLIFSVGFNGQMLPAHAEVTSPSPLAKFTHPGLSYSHRQGNASLAPANDDSEPPTDIAFFSLAIQRFAAEASVELVSPKVVQPSFRYLIHPRAPPQFL